MITQIQELNNNLIAAVKEKLPAGINIANLLMDTLCIGREATYRRLRGEVPFTFAEAAVICRKLEISLDSLVWTGRRSSVVVNLHSSCSDAALDAYKSMLDTQIDTYTRMAEDNTSQIHIASNMMSFINSLYYTELPKFLLFKWLYQKEALSPGMRYDSFEMGEDVLQKHREYVSVVRKINFGSCIWDYMMFDYLFSELRYFSNIGLIDGESLAVIKQDIRQLLDDTEAMAIRGRLETGKEIQLYVSNVNFDATYGYVVGKDMGQAILKICGINLITSSDVVLFDCMKEWVESLRKFSTLISQSGEMQRITFFNKQRANLDAL